MGKPSTDKQGPSKRPERRGSVRRLLRYLRPHGWGIFGASVGFAVAGLLGFAGLLLLKPTVEVLTYKADDAAAAAKEPRAITQQIVTPDGQRLTLTLRDDGRPPDEKADDGLYSAYLPPESGQPGFTIIERRQPRGMGRGRRTATDALRSVQALKPLEQQWDRLVAPVKSRLSKWNDRLRQYAEANRFGALCLIALALIVIAALKGVLEFICQYFLARSCYSMVADLREDLFRKVMGQDYLFFTEHSAGYLQSRIQSDIAAIRRAMESLLRSGFQAPFQLIFLGILLLGLNFRLTMIAFAVALLALGPLVYLARAVKRITRKTKREADRLAAGLEESLRNFALVKFFRSEPFELEKFAQHNRLLLQYYLKNRIAQFGSTPLTQFATAAGRSAVLVVGGYMVLAGQMDFSTLVVFLVTLTRFYGPGRTLSHATTSWPALKVSAERMREILDLEPVIGEPPDGQPLDRVRDSIEFRNVSFSYGRQEALADLSFRIAAGRIVALVGPSGAGKTTLICLLARLFDPTAGSVLIDGIDIRRFRLNDLRRAIGTVTQDTILFDDTVTRNIAYPDAEPDINRVIEAARAANAHEFIEALDGGAGYQAVIGPSGLRLSGGQRQRLAIARALYRDPQILVFDEATSSLDEQAQALVQQAVENLFRGRTVFIIAHRLSTVRRADEILVLNAGRLIERGTHEDLLRRDGFYASLCRIGLEGDTLDVAGVS